LDYDNLSEIISLQISLWHHLYKNKTYHSLCCVESSKFPYGSSVWYEDKGRSVLKHDINLNKFLSYLRFQSYSINAFIPAKINCKSRWNLQHMPLILFWNGREKSVWTNVLRLHKAIICHRTVLRYCLVNSFWCKILFVCVLQICVEILQIYCEHITLEYYI
jgi:hypothetical protein